MGMCNRTHGQAQTQNRCWGEMEQAQSQAQGELFLSYEHRVGHPLKLQRPEQFNMMLCWWVCASF